MVNIQTELCGIKLDNPVIAASGCFGYGAEFAKLYDINILGSFSFKGTTRKERFGNDTPRIAECEGGMLNSIGLQNPGVYNVITEELPKIESYFKKKVIANIGGFSIDEYVEVSKLFDACEQVGWLELNISCPNVDHGGMALGTCPEAVFDVVSKTKKATKKPLIVKLTPNVTDITQIALAAEKAGADAISMINTMLGMRIDLNTGKPVLANKMGGFSGPAIFPVALRMVYQAYEKLSIPIIGLGGIQSADDVIEMMLAGATAVQIGAANLVDPYTCKRIIEDLPDRMKHYGIKKLSDIIGGAH